MQLAGYPPAAQSFPKPFRDDGGRICVTLSEMNRRHAGLNRKPREG